MKQICLMVVMLITVQLSVAKESSIIDSLQYDLERKRAISLRNMALDFNSKNKKTESLHYFNQSFEIFKKLDEPAQLLYILNFTGYIYQLQSNLNNAIDAYLQALEIAETRKIEKDQFVNIWNNLSIIYRKKGEYSESLKYSLRALEHYRQNGSQLGMSRAFENLALTHRHQKCFEIAIKYHNKALKIKQELGNKGEIAKTLANLGQVYRIKKDYKDALKYYEHALKIQQELDSKKDIALTIHNIGLTYFDKGNFNRAIKQLTESLLIEEKLEDRGNYAITLNCLGKAYAQKEEYDKALEYCLKSLDIAEKIGIKPAIKDICYALYEIYTKIDNQAIALQYRQKATEIEQELLSNGIYVSAYEGETKSESTISKQLRMVFYVLAFLFVFVLVLFGILFLFFKRLPVKVATVQKLNLGASIANIKMVDEPENISDTLDEVFEDWLCSSHNDGLDSNERSKVYTHIKALKNFLSQVKIF